MARAVPRRVGIAGAGWVTQYHLPAWRKHAGRVDVVAIADPNAVFRTGRMAEHGIAAGYASVDDMLAHEDLDIIDVCTPVEAHVPVAAAAAARGVAVLCQKPLAPTLAEAQAFTAGLPPSARVMVHDNWRFRATYRRIRDWLDAGVAGTIHRIQLDYVSSGMIPDATGARPALVRQPNFRTLDRLLVMEVLIHHLDTLRSLFGELDLVASTLFRSNDEIVGEDIATLTLMSAQHGAPILVAGNLAVHGEEVQARDQLRIYGSRTTIVLDGFRLSVTGETTLTEAFDPVATYEGAYAAAIEHFLDGLDSGAPFETAPADNLRTLALVEAAYERATLRGGL